jgi:hypothetical protein
VKVDKNTLAQERGKYARLCVEVDLTKKLLGMFSIKSRKYNIEYEGLHSLCITCGKFEHYKESCPEKPKQQEVNGGGQQKEGEGIGVVGGAVDGPWVVVQKTRRQRKGKETTAEYGQGKGVTGNINGDPKLAGSRFIALSTDVPELNEEIPIIIEDNDADKVQGENVKTMVTNMDRNNRLEGGDKQRGRFKKGNNNLHAERSMKEIKLATRGTQSFKGKGGGSQKKRGGELKCSDGRE